MKTLDSDPDWESIDAHEPHLLPDLQLYKVGQRPSEELRIIRVSGLIRAVWGKLVAEKTLEASGQD